MKVGKGIGRVIGRAVRERIQKKADELRPPTRRRPRDLDRTLREAAEEARRKGIRPAGKRGAGQRAGLGGKVRERLGSRFPPELDLLTNAEWKAIEAHARKYLATRPKKAMHIVKGYVAELMVRHLPKFAALRQQVAKELKWLVKTSPRYADLDPTVHFVRDVFAWSPDEKLKQWLQLTDGVLVAFSKEVDAATGRPRRAVILAVFEVKSKNYADLAEQGLTWRKLLEAHPEWKLPANRKPGERKWLGQFGVDYERFAELRTRIGEWEFAPDDVTVSRKKEITRWVAVLPKGESFAPAETAHLVAQGLQVDMWNLPIMDARLAQVAEAVLREAQRPSRATTR